MSSFKECVIVPLVMFQKCKFELDEAKQLAEEIINAKSIPSDVKLKILN
jgi:hypothetical protein